MLLFILLTSTLVIAALATILFGDRLSHWRISSRMMVLLVFLSLLGLIFIIQQTSEISEGLLRQTWPSVNAEIVETNITGQRAYSPEITCRYIVAGNKYILKTDLKTPGFGRKKSRQQTSRIIIAEYSVGSEVSVFYNPDNPQESCIRTGPYWNNYLILALGFTFLCGGLIIFIGFLRKYMQS